MEKIENMRNKTKKNVGEHIFRIAVGISLFMLLVSGASAIEYAYRCLG
jgi:hypothetical protein